MRSCAILLLLAGSLTGAWPAMATTLVTCNGSDVTSQLQAAEGQTIWLLKGGGPCLLSSGLIFSRPTHLLGEAALGDVIGWEASGTPIWTGVTLRYTGQDGPAIRFTGDSRWSRVEHVALVADWPRAWPAGVALYVDNLGLLLTDVGFGGWGYIGLYLRQSVFGSCDRCQFVANTYGTMVDDVRADGSANYNIFRENRFAWNFIGFFAFQGGRGTVVDVSDFEFNDYALYLWNPGNSVPTDAMHFRDLWLECQPRPGTSAIFVNANRIELTWRHNTCEPPNDSGIGNHWDGP